MVVNVMLIFRVFIVVVQLECYDFGACTSLLLNVTFLLKSNLTQIYQVEFSIHLRSAQSRIQYVCLETPEL